MKWLEAMVHRALNDSYLDELTRKLEYKYAHMFLYQKDDVLLTEKEFDDVWRFADILSRCVLNPSEDTFETLKPYIQESYEYAKEKFAKRKDK